jgi:glycosyltransferase involved in cell wall biosynthesis
MQNTALATIKRQLEDYKAYKIARDVKGVLRKHLRSPHKPKDSDLTNKIVSLKPKGPVRGHFLLSFINEPFLLTPEQAGLYGQHTHYWSALEIAETFLEQGYDVDVIRWNNNTFLPKKDYAFFMDFRLNLERLDPVLNKDCIKIMFIETAHWLFHMTAQHNRLFDIQRRKGVSLPPYKTVAPNQGIEHADCGVVLGNSFTMSTYSYANKSLYRVPVISPTVCPWPEEKNFEACRKNFLWFGSEGLVHKGLDLVLDAFSAMPEYHLTVCGPIDGEMDFVRAYSRELYQTPNIHTLGWVKANSPEFIEVANNCVGLIYPSCSEAGGGSVVTCMHAGIIPIISYESSVDIADDRGVILKSNSIETIQDSVRKVSSFSSEQLKRMARNAWEFARNHHTREKFGEQFRRIVGQLTTSQRQEARCLGH